MFYNKIYYEIIKEILKIFVSRLAVVGDTRLTQFMCKLLSLLITIIYDYLLSLHYYFIII